MSDDVAIAGLPLPPRAVRRRRGKPPAGWIALAYLLVGGSLLAVGSFRLYVAYGGTPVRATIDQLAVNTDNDGTTYRAEFHYQLAGQTHHAHGLVSDRLRALLHHADGTPGDGVVPARAVRLPGGHAFCLLEDGPLTWLMLTLAAAWSAVGVPAAWTLYVRPARERRLLRDGSATVGRITAVGPYSPHNRSATIDYTFGSPAVAGHQVAHAPRDQLPHVGDPVTVVHDPARPRRCVAYAFSNYAVS